VIRGTTVSAEHVSGRAEPLNLEQFIYKLDVPVMVGGCAIYASALHPMRTGAAGVLVGFGGVARPHHRDRATALQARGHPVPGPAARRPAICRVRVSLPGNVSVEW
jgi:hypothetical protein